MTDLVTIMRPKAKKSTRFIGGSRVALRPGESYVMARSDLDPRAIAEVISGEFESTPPLMEAIPAAEAEDSIETPSHEDLADLLDNTDLGDLPIPDGGLDDLLGDNEG